MQEIRSNIKYTKNKLIFGYFLKQSWAGGWSDSFALLLILLFTTTTSSSSSQLTKQQQQPLLLLGPTTKVSDSHITHTSSLRKELHYCHKICGDIYRSNKRSKKSYR